MENGMSREIEIDVRVLYEFLGEPVPATPPPGATLETKVREQFSFLPQPIQVRFEGWKGVISYPGEAPAARAEADRLGAKATRRAAEGNYTKAIGILKRVLELEPSNHRWHRDLAMVLVEKGETEEAKDHLIDVLRLQPDDVWGLVVLSNLYSKHKHDLESAERFLKRALYIKPNDPWATNSLASIRMEQGRTDEAAGLFAESIAENPSFVNPHLGLATAQIARGQLDEARRTFEQLFLRAEVQDARSVPVFAEARRGYRELMARLAERQHNDAVKANEAVMRELSDLSGYPIRVRPAETPGNTAAVIQMAWKHKRDHHAILLREDYPAHLLTHLIAHELGHLRLECAARQVGRNRILISAAANREKAIRSMSDDIHRWQRQGFSEQSITDVSIRLTDGMVRQVFNAPIDMLIEMSLHHTIPILRPSQFLSLDLLAEEAEKATLNPEIRARMPKRIVRASAALNGATALFVDRLWGGATAFAAPYRTLDAFPLSQQLLALFDRRAASLRPGDEYEIVDAWAEMLGLKGWYEWREDQGSHEIDSKGEPTGVTNPELLRHKHPATVWYLLEALARFEGMTEEQVRAMSFEIAMLGKSGLDFASSEQKYTLQCCPGESFTGLQLMCYMYAGFSRFAPELDVGMDLREPLETARQLYALQKGADR